MSQIIRLESEVDPSWLNSTVRLSCTRTNELPQLAAELCLRCPQFMQMRRRRRNYFPPLVTSARTKLETDCENEGGGDGVTTNKYPLPFPPFPLSFPRSNKIHFARRHCGNSLEAENFSNQIPSLLPVENHMYFILFRQTIILSNDKIHLQFIPTHNDH